LGPQKLAVILSSEVAAKRVS